MAADMGLIQQEVRVTAAELTTLIPRQQSMRTQATEHHLRPVSRRHLRQRRHHWRHRLRMVIRERQPLGRRVTVVAAAAAAHLRHLREQPRAIIK